MAVLSYLDSDPKTHVPMTKEQTELYIRCYYGEQAKPDQMFELAEAEQCGDIGRIFYHRLTLAGPIKMSLGVALFVLSLAGGVPGRIVMWAYTMNRMYKRKAESIGGHLTMEDLSFCFPMGFPSEQEEHRLWDAQKGHCHGRKCDNMVDQMDTWTDGFVVPSEESSDVGVENDQEG